MRSFFKKYQKLQWKLFFLYALSMPASIFAMQHSDNHQYKSNQHHAHHQQKISANKKTNRKHAVASGWRALLSQQPRGNWQVTAGAMTLWTPRRQGEYALRVLPLPFFSIVYKKRLILSAWRGLGVYLLNDRHTKIGATINYNFQTINAIKNNRTGFPHIKTFLDGSMFMMWRWRMFNLNSSYRQALTSNYGGVWRNSFSVGAPLSSHLLLAIGPSLAWATGRYMRTFYGINSEESAASGLPAHRTHAGILQMGEVTSMLWFYNKWIAQSMLSLNWFQGSAYRSPLIKKRFQYTAIISLSYRFL